MQDQAQVGQVLPDLGNSQVSKWVPDCALPLVSHHHGDDEAGVDYDAHRSGSRAARASATRAMASPDAPF